MSRVILITYRDKLNLRVSHGIDEDTYRQVCLPPEPIEYFIQECNAKLDEGIGEYYIEGNEHGN